MIHSCLLFGDEDDSQHAKRELAVANRVWSPSHGWELRVRRNHATGTFARHMLWGRFRQVLLQKVPKRDEQNIMLMEGSKTTTRKDVAKTLWIMGNLSYLLVQDFWSINMYHKETRDLNLQDGDWTLSRDCPIGPRWFLLRFPYTASGKETQQQWSPMRLVPNMP